MFDFSSITEVRLARGKHKSPREGLCFMEMVAWFEGEKHSDHPACACPTLASYGRILNDSLPDDLRDRLLKPLVPHIAGTAGTDKDELRRARVLVLWAATRIMPVALDHIGKSEWADDLRRAEDLNRAPILIERVRDALHPHVNNTAQFAVYDYATNCSAAIHDLRMDLRKFPASAVAAIPFPEITGPIAVEALDMALDFGPRRGLTDPRQIPARHKALRQLVRAA